MGGNSGRCCQREFANTMKKNKRICSPLVVWHNLVTVLLFNTARGINWDILPSKIDVKDGVTLSSRALKGRGPQMIVMVVLAALGAFAFMFGAGAVEGFKELRNKGLEAGDGMALLTCIIVFLCLVLLMNGIRSLRHIRCTLVLNERSVQLTLSLLGKAGGMWREPLINYEGIQFVVDQVITGEKNAPPRSLVAVVLHHAVPYKCIRLCEMDGGNVDQNTRVDYMGGGPYRKTCEAYAEILNLPVLEKTRQGKTVRRRIEDFNKPAGILVREGEIQLNYAPNIPPRGLLVTCDGVEVTIKRFLGRRALKRILIINLVSLGFMGIFFLLLWAGSGPGSPIFLLPITFGFLFIFINSVIIAQNLRNFVMPETRVTFTNKTVRISSITKTGTLLESKEQPLTSIEEIHVNDSDVLLLGDMGNTMLCTPSQAAAEWLRDAILDKAARCVGKRIAQPQDKKAHDRRPDSHAFVPQMGTHKTNKQGSPFKRILVGIFLVLWGLVSSLGVSNIVYAKARSTSWPTTHGVIKVSKTDTQGRADVTYGYTVKGKEYTGSCVNFHDYHHNEGIVISARYPVGKTVTVSYNPVGPSDSCLEPGLKIRDFFPKTLSFMLTGIFSFIAGCVLISIAIRERLSNHPIGKRT